MELVSQPLGKHAHTQRQQPETTRSVTGKNVRKLRFDVVKPGRNVAALADLADERKRIFEREALQVHIVAVFGCVELESTIFGNL